MKTRLTSLVATLLLGVGCHNAQNTQQEKGPQKPDFLSENAWNVDSVLAQLSMEERVAQLLMVPIYSRTDTAGWAEAEQWTRDLQLGGGLQERA